MSEGIAIAFLARGAEIDWRASCERFLHSYQSFEAGVDPSYS
jgi:hypothetical protein